MSYSKKEIGSIALVSVGILIIWIYISTDSIIHPFIMENRKAFWTFLFSFFILILVTGFLYQRTLDFVDELTPLTIKYTRFNIVLWCLFWICWCVYNVSIIFNYSFSNKLFIFSFLWTTLPGILFFIYAIWSRNDEIKVRNNSDIEVSSQNFETAKKLLRITYFVGFYGIFTIPVYLLIFFILLFIK
jgi:hypothetical protein